MQDTDTRVMWLRSVHELRERRKDRPGRICDIDRLLWTRFQSCCQLLQYGVDTLWVQYDLRPIATSFVCKFGTKFVDVDIASLKMRVRCDVSPCSKHLNVLVALLCHGKRCTLAHNHGAVSASWRPKYLASWFLLFRRWRGEY